MGNALHALLRGPLAMTAGAEALDRSALERLEAALVNVQPAGMLAALRQPSAEDRALLAQACGVAFDLAGSDAGRLLGMERAEAAPVFGMLSGK